VSALNRQLGNAAGYASLIQSLIDGRCTALELITESGLAGTTVRKFLSAMRRRGLVHIAGWEADSVGRMVMPVWELGEGRDSARPKQTATERSAKRREKMRRSRIEGRPVWTRARAQLGVES